MALPRYGQKLSSLRFRENFRRAPLRSAEAGAKGLVTQSVWILTGRAIGAVLQAVSMALLARWSGVAEFGFFAAAYGAAIFVQEAAGFGLRTYLVRMRAQYPDAKIVGGLLRLETRIDLWVAGIGFLAAVAAAILDARCALLIPLAIWLAADKHTEAWLAIPLSDGSAWQNSVSLVARRAGALAIFLGAVSAGVEAGVSFATGLAVSSLASALFLRSRISTYVRTAGKIISFRETFRATRSYWINSLAAQARNMDTVIVGAILGAGAAGYYGAAARLTTPLQMIPSSFASVLMPAAAKAKSGDRSIIKPTIFLLIVSAIFYAVIASFTPIVVPAVLGDEYAGAVRVIQVVCVGLTFSSAASQLNALLQGWGYPAPVARISVTSTSACLVSVAGASMLFGVMGAGVALAGSYALQTVLLLFAARKVWRRLRAH